MDCMTIFMLARSINAAVNAGLEAKKNGDSALEYVIHEMSTNSSQIWNSLEIWHQYEKHGGKDLVHFGDDIAVLSSSGLASLIVFRKSASTLLYLVNDSDEDELSILTDKLAKTITSEVRDISVDKSRYNVRITKEDISKSVSLTLMDLLGKLSAHMDYTLPALLIGNIGTGIICNNPTNLQIALGNLIRDSKSLINQMYQFGVTCSYDEILRFKKSAALAATNDIQLSGIHEGDGGLIQTLVDNFDADISSQNGKLTMHSLAMLIMQPCTQPDENQNIPSTIPRVSKADMFQQIDF